jgi:serine/threonine protein kinase
MDPEYVVTQELTEKSDIYSYGVLLLELVTGRRAIQDRTNLVEWAQSHLSSGAVSPELVDPRIRGAVDVDHLHVVVGIVQWCTHREGRQRPSVRQVLRMLSERLDPGNGSFGEGMEDAEGGFYPRSSRCGGAHHRNELVPYGGGDMRSLHSSSSTTRSSYCSRSMLLESGQTQSPPETQ